MFVRLVVVVVVVVVVVITFGIVIFRSHIMTISVCATVFVMTRAV